MKTIIKPFKIKMVEPIQLATPRQRILELVHQGKTSGISRNTNLTGTKIPTAFYG